MQLSARCDTMKQSNGEGEQHDSKEDFVENFNGFLKLSKVDHYFDSIQENETKKLKYKSFSLPIITWFIILLDSYSKMLVFEYFTHKSNCIVFILTL